MIEELRKRVTYDVVDYQHLMFLLQSYKKPRDKLKRLVDSGKLLRLKEGLYVFSEVYRKEPLNLPLIANLLYGPSYVSCQYALSWYGLIPERVIEVTSMTVGRKKRFETEVGRFSYSHLDLKRYSAGIDFVQDPASRRPFLMATPDKALADMVTQVSGIENLAEMREYLEEDLRFDPPDHFKISDEVIKAYETKKVLLLQRMFL